LMLRQRELALREQELRMRRGPGPGPGPGPRRGPPTPSMRKGGFDEDEDEDDYFDPTSAPPPPMIDPDSFDMMSVTSRRNRKAQPPSASQLRKNPEFNTNPQRRGGFPRPGFNRNSSSARLIDALPSEHDSLMNDPMMAYSSNRYGNVDRQSLGQESRANSLTAARLDELQFGGAYGRRASQSPGNPFSPNPGRPNGRPSPPNGYPYNNYPPNGRPSPPGGVRQPVPRYPPGQGNMVEPQQVEQAGVSAPPPPTGMKNVRSLTGSASASAGSGESAHLDSENSAHSSQSSLGHRPPIGVR